jgi:hypothetical protein
MSVGHLPWVVLAAAGKSWALLFHAWFHLSFPQSCVWEEVQEEVEKLRHREGKSQEGQIRSEASRCSNLWGQGRNAWKRLRHPLEIVKSLFEKLSAIAMDD